MRVVHVCQRDDASTGGAVRVAVECVKRLPSHGVDARILFLYGERGPFSEQLGGRSDYLGLSSSRDVFKYRWLKRYIRRIRPHIVHHHDDLLWPQLVTLKHHSYKKIIHAHGGGTAKPQPLKTRILYACQRHSADGVVCITEEAEVEQRKNVGFKEIPMRVISNGVDLNLFSFPTAREKMIARKRLGLPNDAPVVGFVGRLCNEMKGVDDFVRVMAALPAKFIGLVAGDGPDLSTLKGLAEDLGVTQRLHFVGLLNNTAVAYQAMDVFCFTSRFEPFGLTIIEAMACKVPVVGFNCPGGSGEILNDRTGVVISNRDVNEMASRVRDAYDTRAGSVDRLDTAYNRLADTYSWEQSVEQLADLYRHMLSKGNKAS